MRKRSNNILIKNNQIKKVDYIVFGKIKKKDKNINVMF